tara:strand:+ start:497 stop:640 length:144 start_codon:yes stop_codon:yes gene_type:complete
MVIFMDAIIQNKLHNNKEGNNSEIQAFKKITFMYYLIYLLYIYTIFQ